MPCIHNPWIIMMVSIVCSLWILAMPQASAGIRNDTAIGVVESSQQFSGSQNFIVGKQLKRGPIYVQARTDIRPWFEG